MRKTCFACQEGECLALKPAPCAEGQPCRFYKTTARAEADLQRVYGIIAGKPIEHQQYIAGKYHNGKMPWRKKEDKRHDR